MNTTIRSLATTAMLVFVNTAALVTPTVAFAQSSNENPEIIGDFKRTAIAPATSAAEARRLGRYVYDRPTPQNSILLLIDHQTGLVESTRDYKALSEFKNNIVGLAKLAKVYDIPVLLTTSNAQWQNGELLPELKALFPTDSIIRRYGIINAYEDPTFRAKLTDIMKRTGRTHIILAGVTIGTCTLFPTLSMLQDGLRVFPVIDAAGAWSQYEMDAAASRMGRAGAELTTVFSLAAELQADWKNPTANAAAAVFHDHLPEYGNIMDLFWTSSSRKSPKDPFGLIK